MGLYTCRIRAVLLPVNSEPVVLPIDSWSVPLSVVVFFSVHVKLLAPTVQAEIDSVTAGFPLFSRPGAWATDRGWRELFREKTALEENRKWWGKSSINRIFLEV